MQNGVFCALLAYAIYSVSDGIIKSLGGHLSVFEIGLMGTVFAALFLPVMTPEGESWRGFWRMQRPLAVQVRAISGVLAGILGVYAFTTIPMAEVYALFFLAPLFVTILSVLFLGEKVGPWRWAAVIMGFLGIVLVVRPGFAELELGHLAAAFVAVMAAITIILMRSLSGERQTTMLGMLMLYTMLANLIGVALTGFTMPDWRTLLALVLIGACTAAAHRLQLLAARLSPANLIAPTHYSQMLWAVIIGAFFFAEYPDWISILGLAVVAASGLLTLARERIRLGTVRWNPFGRNRF